ncbi:MAG: class I SAM-dependent methyltransferase [Chloroflexota bacterium]
MSAVRADAAYRREGFAEGYFAHWEPVLTRPALSLLDALESQGVNTGGRVLDIGAGTGLITIELLRRWPASTVVACDTATAMLQVIRRRASDLGLGDRVEVLEGDAEALPLAEGSVDVAVSSFVFQLVPDRGRALREAWRVLRPGATLGYVTWLARTDTFEPGVAVDSVLGEDLSIDLTGGKPKAGDVPSLGPAGRELEEAGYTAIRVTPGSLDEAWTVDRYLAYVEGCRNVSAFAGLDDQRADALRARLREALEAVPSAAFIQRDRVVWAIGRRPDPAA